MQVRIPSLALSIALLAAPAVAEPPRSDAPPQDSAPAQSFRPARDRFDEEFEIVRAQLLNAAVRLRNGIVGMGLEEGVEPTPMRICCGSNLRHIGSAGAGMRLALDDLETCYADEGVVGGPAALGFARRDLETLLRGVGRLADAAKKHEARLFLDGLTRSFLQLEKTKNGLPPCGEETDPGEASEGAESDEDQ